MTEGPPETTANMLTEDVPVCYLCGSSGEAVYESVRDSLFGVAGTWRIRQCSSHSCDLMWLDPRPIESEIWKAYSSYYTHVPLATRGRVYRAIQNAWLAVAGRYGHLSFVDRLALPLGSLHPGGADEFRGNAMFLEWPGDGARVLDIGCGAGDLLVTMRELGWNVEGIDFDSRAVAAAAARGIPARTGTLHQQRYPDATFDAVYLGHVIEHLHDPIALLRECRRILKPGGTLVVVTPNIRSAGHRHFGIDWRGLEPPRHLHLFSRATMAEMLRRAGFSEFSVGVTTRGARLVLSISRISRYVRLTGKPATTYPPMRRKIEGIVFQYVERFASIWNREAGEELVARARPGSND